MRKAFWMIISLLLVALMWYLFIRPFEFEVNLKAKTLPGDIIETIRIWNRSLDNAKITKVDSFSGLDQNIVLNERSYLYGWTFEVINDSLTQVKIKITQPDRSLANKILIPFTDQHIEKDANVITHEFYNVLKTHLEITKVKLQGESEIASSFCACQELETKQIEKANGMMKYYVPLTAIIGDFNLKVDGPPIVKVREWNHNLGMLKFDFCFPIIKTDSLPTHNTITFKEIKREKALRAVYNGNYITSDRAWYALIHYANSNGYEINGLPVEYFHNNPNLGMNEGEWKADVFLPIK